jgi:signal transduction histidine kinase
MLAAFLLAIAIPSLWFSDKPHNSLHPDVWAVLLTCVAVLPVAWRRRRPDIVLVVCGTAQFVLLAAGYPIGSAFVGVMLAIYTYARHRRRRWDVWPVLVWLFELLLLLPLALERTHGFNSKLGILYALVLVSVVAWGIGDTVRTVRMERRRRFERAESEEREREARTLQARAEERALIAREIHDVVAHALGVVIMLSTGAGRLRHLDESRAREALGNIESTSRQAFGEIRRLVTGLREEESEAELAPQPRIGDIPVLVSSLCHAGLDVSLGVSGASVSLPSGVELSAFRIVQEALTNCLRHAPGASAKVNLIWGQTHLDLEIVNDAPALGAPVSGNGALTDNVGRHGIVGMRERVLLYGGRFSAGALPGGGFRVWASLPLAAQS